MITAVNSWISSLLPAEAWDYLEFFVGLALITLSALQRRFSKNLQVESITCWADWITTRLAHNCLVGLIILGAMLMADAMQPGLAPPRSIVIIGLMLICGVQLRVLHYVFTLRRRERRVALENNNG